MPSDPSLPIVAIDHAELLTWRIQRIGWLILGGLVIPAALFGVFGAGPFARVERGVASDTLAFDRVMRLGVEREWRLRVVPVGEIVTLRMGSGFTEHFSVRDWTPAPARIVVDRGSLTATFVVRQDAPTDVVVRLAPARVGRFTVDVAAGTSRWDASVLVLP